MLLISADDFGHSRLATDNTVTCFKRGTITSVSAMVFMDDSQRALDQAKGLGLDMGLHLNFTQRTSMSSVDRSFSTHHEKIVRYLSSEIIPFFLYNFPLQKSFEYTFNRQYEEFLRIAGDPPTHIDGHHHAHLCANMIFGRVIPAGQIIRRNFTYFSGEKNTLNRAYRLLTDKILQRRYRIVEFLFSLSEQLKWDRLGKRLELATPYDVELQSHPENETEFRWLNMDSSIRMLNSQKKGNFKKLMSSLSGQIDDQA